MERMPHAAQMMRLRPTEPVSSRSPLGDTKIPEPIIVPAIRATPPIRDTVLFKPTALGFDIESSTLSSDVINLP